MSQLIRSNDPCWCGSGRKYKRCHRAQQKRVLPGTVTPRRTVPGNIDRPDYVENGRPVRVDEPMVKSGEIVERMRTAGLLAAEVLSTTAAAIEAGVTTDELDAICHEATISRGAYPSPLNYHGFPKSICTSVNEVICHGIPDSRPLAEGDIVNLDVTVYIDGVHGDTSATFAVGRTDDESERLVRVTEQCLESGISAVRPGQTNKRHWSCDRAARRQRGLQRDPLLLRPRHRGGFPFPSPDSPLLRPERIHDHGAGHDVHDRADDRGRHVAPHELGGRLDCRNRRPAPDRAVRAHHPCDSYRCGSIDPILLRRSGPDRAQLLLWWCMLCPHAALRHMWLHL